MTTVQQDEAFIKDIIDRYLLEKAIEWIQQNMNPEDVFTKQELIDWAKKNNDPEDVFDERALEIWAEDNGYSKEE